MSQSLAYTHESRVRDRKRDPKAEGVVVPLWPDFNNFVQKLWNFFLSSQAIKIWFNTLFWLVIMVKNQCLGPTKSSLIFQRYQRTQWLKSLKTGRLKRSQFSFLFLSIENLEKMFYSFTYISIDYLVHGITKEFWKNSHFASMRDGFLLRRQNSLR